MQPDEPPDVWPGDREPLTCALPPVDWKARHAAEKAKRPVRPPLNPEGGE